MLRARPRWAAGQGVCVLRHTASPHRPALCAQPPNPRPLQCTASPCRPCAQVGNEVRGNNTAEGADGKSQASAFVFPYPFTTGAQLYFTVTVVVGGTRSEASLVFGPIVVGEWRLQWWCVTGRCARWCNTAAVQACASTVPSHIRA